VMPVPARCARRTLPYLARHRLIVAHRLHRETDRRGPQRAFDPALVARLDLSLYHAAIAVLKGALAATMQRRSC
jgi:hypothetical protein